MKTLVNKANPEIRITAPEIEETTTLGYTNYEIAREGMYPLFFNPKEWTLVEEEQEQPSSNLDEVAEEYANKEYPDEPSVGQWGTGDYEPPIDREYLREIAKDAFKEGVGWKEKQDEPAWKDLQKLDIIANKLWQDGKYDKNDAQEFYTEVLKRFKEYKEQKNKEI